MMVFINRSGVLHVESVVVDGGMNRLSMAKIIVSVGIVNRMYDHLSCMLTVLVRWR